MKRKWLFATFLLLVVVRAFVSTQTPAAAAAWAQQHFFVTFWGSPPATDENFARVAAEGFNFIRTSVEGLDVAARHGLRAMLTTDLLNPAVLDDDAKRAQLDELIDRVKGHRALEAYFLIDEPSAGAFPRLGQLVAHLRERDPAHLAYINLFPTYANEQQLGVSAEAAERARVSYPTDFAGVGNDDKAVLRYREHLRQFIATVQPDLLSYDHYHFLKESDGREKDGTEYFLNLGMIRRAGLEAHRPFLNIIQANTIVRNFRLPNANEIRWLVFTTMAYGGRGISYFTYWGPKAYNGLYQDGQAAPLLTTVVALNHEIVKLGPALMELNSVGVYHTSPLPSGAEAIPAKAAVQIEGTGEFVLGLFGKDSQPTAFMIVNRNYQREAEATATVSIPGQELQELDRQTGKWVRSQRLDGKRTVRITLALGDGRLFLVTR
jgi:hypothetical protein